MYSIQEQMYMYPHTSWGRNARVWSLVPDLKKEKPKCPKRNDMKEDNEMRGLRTRGSKASLGVVPLDVEDTLVEVAVREIAEKTGGHVEITRATGGAWRGVVSMLFFFLLDSWLLTFVHDSGESKFLSGSVPSPDLLVADGAIILGRVHSHNAKSNKHQWMFANQATTGQTY